jgi:hypothetical protein
LAQNEFKILIQDCDAAIRTGHPQEVAKHLAKFETRDIPRMWRVPLAKVCRRAGLYSLGLSLLSRIVRSEGIRGSTQATPAETSEYAALLLRYGAVAEAEELLLTVDASQAPDALLYRAYVYFTRWEFSEAIPFLRLYLETPLPLYQQLVGQTNLAFAMVEARQHSQALTLLDELIRNTREGGHLLLECHCLVYRAQAYFQEGDMTRAREQIVEAKRHFTMAKTNDHMLVTKWDMILEGLATNRKEPFEQLRELAIKHNDWGTSRDADLFSLRVDFNQERFLHLYFGTPFPRFKEQMLKDLGVTCDRDLYILGPKSAPRLDIRTGEIDGNAALNPGRKSHQLIEVLLRDFYEPMRVPSIFSALFPLEHFNVDSSADRIHKIIRRTRHWLRVSEVPVEIRLLNGFYSLALTGDFSFRIPLRREKVDPVLLHFQELKQAYAKVPVFSAKSAREALGLSKTTIRRVLDWGLANEELERLGQSHREATYRLKRVA